MLAVGLGSVRRPPGRGVVCVSKKISESTSRKRTNFEVRRGVRSAWRRDQNGFFLFDFDCDWDASYLTSSSSLYFHTSHSTP